MKHGINTEVHAKPKYKTLFKKSHMESSFKDPGMTHLSPISLTHLSLQALI